MQWASRPGASTTREVIIHDVVSAAKLLPGPTSPDKERRGSGASERRNRLRAAGEPVLSETMDLSWCLGSTLTANLASFSVLPYPCGVRNTKLAILNGRCERRAFCLGARWLRRLSEPRSALSPCPVTCGRES